MFHNWLQPLPIDELFASDFKDFQIGNQLQLFTKKIPSLKKTQIAIIGVGSEAANTIRKYFYPLSYAFDGLKIADLGNVRKAEPEFIIPLLKELYVGGVFPLLIGQGTELVISQYKAFQGFQSLINLVLMDEQFRISYDNTDIEHNFLDDIVHKKRSKLFHLGFIGSQAHFLDPRVFQFLNERHYEFMRLGKVKAELQESEPLIRDADIISLNLAVLKQSEAPGQVFATPSGLTLEESCQLARYSGLSDKLKSFSIMGYDLEQDNNYQTAKGVAQMVWYFLDGFNNRKNDFPISTDGLVEYIVDSKKLAYQIVFWKSNKSGRWWMQVPVKSSKKYQHHYLVPCSYKDYKMASQDELPDRLFSALQRFL